MENKELYYCYGLNRSSDGTVSEVFLIKVRLAGKGEAPQWLGCELLPPMSVQRAEEYGIAGLSPKKGESGLFGGIAAQRLPAVHMGEDGTAELSLIPFAGRYHRLNPKKLGPSKTALLRTVTVLGETVHQCRKYVNYYMTNRKIQMLDEEHVEYGYYVCDYNGAVSYLSFEKMQIIGNRYGFTNARVSGSRITALDGSLLPQLARPESARAVCNDGEVCYIKNDGSTTDYEISVLRHYADSFFSVRRRRLAFDESSPKEVVNEALRELVTSVEAFHQALLWDSVPAKEYARIRERAEELFSSDSGVVIRNEMLCQVKTPYFQPTDAFETMLAKCGSQRKKFANLQTLAMLSRDIQDKYCGILLAEQEITDLLIQLGEKFGYKLCGLEHRIKSPDSLYEKLYERADGEGKSLEAIFESLKDILRYTVCFDSVGDYSKNIEELLKCIIEKYHGQLESFKNYWAPYVSGEYRGINAAVRLPDMCWDMREKRIRKSEYASSRYCVAIPSFCFEVQFHTQQSLEVKGTNHKLYEINRRSDVTEEERRKNDAQMKENVKSIVMPKDAEYLSMMSNEYVRALQDSIRLMQSELADREKKEGLYVDKGLIKR